MRLLTDKQVKKALKSKKSHSLVESERLLRELVKNSGSTIVSFIMRDGDGTKYTCDDVALAVSVSIIELLQEELFSSLEELQEDGGDGAEAAQALLTRLCEQYREEQRAAKSDDSSYKDDFAELDQSYTSPAAPEPESNSGGILDFLDPDHGGVPIPTPEEEGDISPAVEALSEAEGSSIVTPIYTAPRQKHEMITFPSQEEFLDLSGQDDSIRRYMERLDKESLIKFLGLEQGEERHPLEEKRCAYAWKRLNDPVFELLRDDFRHAVANLIDTAKTILSESYDKVIDVDYEAVAESELSPELDEIGHTQTTELESFLAEEDRLYNLQLETFEKEQLNALEIFKRQQEIDKDVFVQKQEEKLSERRTLFERDLEDRLSEETSELLDKKLCALKQASKEVLSEDRRHTVRELEKGLETLIENKWGEIMKELDHVQAELETRTPDMLAVVDSDRAEARALRDDARQDAELELKKDRLRMEQETEQEMRNEKAHEWSALAQVQERLISLDNKLENQKSEDNAAALIAVKQGERRRTRLFAVGFLLALAFFLASAYWWGSGVLATQAEREDRLLERLGEVEEQLGEAETREYELLESFEQRLEELLYEPETLDSLLADGRFNEAIQRYGSGADNLNQIGEVLYESGALTELISFNRTFRTMFGEFDEALLRRDFNTALALYREMDEITLLHLTQPGQRLNDFVILLYQNCHRRIADELLAGI